MIKNEYEMTKVVGSTGSNYFSKESIRFFHSKILSFSPIVGGCVFIEQVSDWNQNDLFQLIFVSNNGLMTRCDRVDLQTTLENYDIAIEYFGPVYNWPEKTITFSNH